MSFYHGIVASLQQYTMPLVVKECSVMFNLFSLTEHCVRYDLGPVLNSTLWSTL